MHPQYLAMKVSELAAPDAVFSADVGTPTVWAARYLAMNGRRRLLLSGNHGSMANAMPQALGAQAAFPGRQVVSLSGDGGFAMSMGDLLSLRQNGLPVKIILFNNQIYGLTKGQYSPTSALGTRAASTPVGSVDHPLNPIALALGAGATFVARAADTDAKLMGKILEQAYAHKGAVFIEMLQNCPVFNDGVWEAVKDDPAGKQIVLADGKPLVFANGTKGIKLGAGMVPEICDANDPGVLVHSEKGSPLYANLLSQLVQPDFPMPMGVLYRHEKPTYNDLAIAQVTDAITKQGKGDLEKLMYSGMVWEVGADGTRH